MDALPEAVVYLCAGGGRVLRFNQKAAELWERTPTVGDPQERFCGSFRLYRTDGTLLPHDSCAMAVALQTGGSFRDQEVVLKSLAVGGLSAAVISCCEKDFVECVGSTSTSKTAK
jgi:hypothetical protein